MRPSSRHTLPGGWCVPRDTHRVSQGPVPRVAIRTPRILLVWPLVFTGAMTAFVTAVLTHAPRESDGSDPPSVVASVLMVVCLVGLPATSLVVAFRAGVGSEGTNLRIRSGLTTRIVPAHDIDRFVIIDRVGRRREEWPYRSAIALRPGSPAARHDAWADRPAWARVARRGLLVLCNRRVGDIPVPGTGSSLRGSWARSVHVIAELAEWHHWALETVRQHRGIAGATG